MAVAVVVLALLAAQAANTPKASAQPSLRLFWKQPPALTYCHTDGESLGGIRVEGDLVFENNGKRPLLLLRQAPEYHGFVMRPVGPLPTGHRPYESYVTLVHPVRPEFTGYKQIDFIHLRPTERYIAHWSTGFLYGSDGGEPLLKVGDYQLSFQISVWHDSEEDAIRVAKALGKFPIWIYYLWSEPVQVEVNSATPTTELCH
jgi:hypothetical protein